MKPVKPRLREGEISSGQTRLSAKERLLLLLEFQRYLLPYWDKVLLSMVINLFVLYSLLLFPVLNAKFVDVAIPQRDYTLYFAILGLLGIVGFFLNPGLLSVAMQVTSELCRWFTGLSIHYHLQLMFFRHLHSLSMRFFEKRPIGEHMYRAQADVFGSLPMITDPIPRLVSLLAGQTFTVFVAVQWFMDLEYGKVIICGEYVYMLVGWAIYHWSRTIERRLAHELQRRSQAVSAGMQDGLAGFLTVKACGRQGTEVSKMVHLLGRELVQNLKIFWFGFLMRHVTGQRLLSVHWFHGIGVSAGTAWMVIHNQMTLGESLIVPMFLLYLVRPFGEFFNFIQDIRLGLVPLERLRDTLSVAPAVVAPRKGVRLSPLQGRIVVDHASFRYEEELVLRDISFEIPAGLRVGIVGPSGSGKSTLLGLLLRLHDPVEGRVLVDGHDIRTLHLVDYHHQIGPVLQETHLFLGSLRENMLYAKPNATDDEIRMALRRAEVLDFVETLPDGLDTDLSEGTRLSGGQRQRIGIARAILRDPAMLVFDEPTSSLDIPTEHAIVKTLESVIEGRTTFFVSHRLGLASGCDMILVLDEGRLVGIGPHNDLLKTCLLYRTLWTEQYGEAEGKR